MADAVPSTSNANEVNEKEVDPSLAPLTHFVDRPDDLADHTLSSIDWATVESMMPRILKGKSQEDVKQLLLAEIDGMSKKRLLAVLNGIDFEESSSSEDESEEEEVDKNEKEGEEEVNMEVSEGENRVVPEEESDDRKESDEKDVDGSGNMEDGEIDTDSGEEGEDEEEDEQKAFDRQIDKELEDFFD